MHMADSMHMNTPCHSYSQPSLRWRINGSVTLHEPSAAEQQDEAPRVLFVPTQTWPSANHRCVDAAKLTKQSSLPCSELNETHVRRFDVFVHCKFLCSGLYGLLGSGTNASRRAVHILDRVDSYGHISRRFRRLSVDGEIFNTREHMESSCGSRACVVIPHHYNLGCAPRPDCSGLEGNASTWVPQAPSGSNARTIPGAHKSRCPHPSHLAAGAPARLPRRRAPRVAIGLVGSVNDAIVSTLRAASDVHLLFEPFNATAPHEAQRFGAPRVLV